MGPEGFRRSGIHPPRGAARSRSGARPCARWGPGACGGRGGCRRRGPRASPPGWPRPRGDCAPAARRCPRRRGRADGARRSPRGRAPRAPRGSGLGLQGGPPSPARGRARPSHEGATRRGGWRAPGGRPDPPRAVDRPAHGGERHDRAHSSGCRTARRSPSSVPESPGRESTMARTSSRGRNCALADGRVLHPTEGGRGDLRPELGVGHRGAPYASRIRPRGPARRAAPAVDEATRPAHEPRRPGAPAGRALRRPRANLRAASPSTHPPGG